MEKREQDPERMEFQDEEDLDEMEEKEARGSTRDRTRALPGGPKMLEEDQDMTDDGCCGEKRTPDYKEEQRKRLKRIQDDIDTMAQDEAGSYQRWKDQLEDIVDKRIDKRLEMMGIKQAAPRKAGGQLVRRSRENGTLETARKLEAPRVRYTADDGSLVSNDMFDYVRVGCRLCRKRVNMSNLRGHTRRCHSTTITEYKRIYGAELIPVELVWHKCGICGDLVMLDFDCIEKHLNQKGHPEITHQAYKLLYMVDTRKGKSRGPDERGVDDSSPNSE